MTRRSVILLAACAVAVLALAACSGDGTDEAAPSMTKAQRDSALAASRLPGAGAVAGALAADDSAQARKNRLDEISGSGH